MGRSSISELVQDTEREIFNAAADPDEALLTDADIADDGLDEVEGWDGEPLEIDEIMTAAALPDPNNNDRPIALHNQQESDRIIIEQNKAILDFQQQTANAQRAAEYQAQAEERGLNLLVDHDGLKNAVIRSDQQQQQINQLHEARMNDHLNYTAEKYGDRFQTAYQYLTSQPVTPTSSALVREILASPNPGESIIGFYEAGGASHSSGGNVMPPSLNSQTPAAGRSGVGRYSEWASDAMESRPYSAERAEEDSIMNYAFNRR